MQQRRKKNNTIRVLVRQGFNVSKRTRDESEALRERDLKRISFSDVRVEVEDDLFVVLFDPLSVSEPGVVRSKMPTRFLDENPFSYLEWLANMAQRGAKYVAKANEQTEAQRTGELFTKTLLVVETATTAARVLAQKCAEVGIENEHFSMERYAAQVAQVVRTVESDVASVALS